jgi:ribose-phosphate pyrophosphokinase
MITLFVNDKEVAIKSFVFPAGEIQVSIDCDALIPEFLCPDNLTCVAYLNNATDILELLLVDDILARNAQNYNKTLIIPYLPYGRQDRIMAHGEAFSLRVIANLINNISFKKIITFDCHSHVTQALITNLAEMTQLQCIKKVLRSSVELESILKNAIIIAPDAGAAKKAYEISREFKRPLAIAEKIRDITTGNIIRTRIDAEGKIALIVDDICDGGTTFIELAKCLRNQGFEKVYLYITHGIFSQGLDVFDGLIDHIFTTNSFHRVPMTHQLLTTVIWDA